MTKGPRSWLKCFRISSVDEETDHICYCGQNIKNFKLTLTSPKTSEHLWKKRKAH